MKRFHILILTTIFILAVPFQTFSKGQSESGGFFKENNSKDNNSDIDSNSGFFRIGGTENTGDGGGATKESELPSDGGNVIIIASILFAASYMLVRKRIRTEGLKD